jgi:HK97 family phage major capsid protein
MPLDNMDEIKGLIEAQGKGFEAFKATLDEMKKSDVVTSEKLAKIEKDLDAAVEAKAKIEARMDAERKEREDLELRLSKSGDRGGDEKKAAAVRDFQNFVKSMNAERGRVAPVIDEAAYDGYKSAFQRFVREGKDALDAAEVKTLSVGSDVDGGFLVTPDMSGRIAKRVFETSPIRQIANVQAISSDKLEGIEDLDEAAAGWVGEQQSRGDTGTPNIGKYAIEAFEVYAKPKATQKLLDDASVDIEAWLAEKVATKIARVENLAYVRGTGAAQPRGFTSYPALSDDGSGVTWGSLGYVPSGASADFAAANPADKLFDLIGTLKTEYLTNARFVTRRSVITKIRKFKDGDGAYLWQPSLGAGLPELLAGYPITRAEDMPALAANSMSLAFGDFQQGYQIVDRLGLRTLRDPYSDKPYVVFYTIKRTGGAVVNFEAIKLMRFAAS